MCEQEQEQREWLEAFRKVISQPMTPEDYASKILLLHLTQYSFLCLSDGINMKSMCEYTTNSLVLCYTVDEATLRRGK